MTPLIELRYFGSKRAILSVKALLSIILLLSASCSRMRTTHLWTRFRSAKGIQVGTPVYLRESSTWQQVFIGTVDQYETLPGSKLSNNDSIDSGQDRVEVGMKIKQSIEGKPWFELIRADSRVLKSTDIDFLKKRAFAIIIITQGTNAAEPCKENQLLPGSMADLESRYLS